MCCEPYPTPWGMREEGGLCPSLKPRERSFPKSAWEASSEAPRIQGIVKTNWCLSQRSAGPAALMKRQVCGCGRRSRMCS